MKKYKRRVPLISPIKIAICAIGLLIAILITYFFDKENMWIIIFNGLLIELLAVFCFTILANQHNYSYGNSVISLFYFITKYKKIKYTDFSYVCISNASYNNGYGYYFFVNIPMKYRNKRTKGVVFPFITLHKPNYPLNKIKSGMYSRDLFMLQDMEIYCLGICWFDSFEELLEHCDMPIYVLEDVYLRFRGKFDSIFVKHEADIDRFYIISEHIIEYKKYKTK